MHLAEQMADFNNIDDCENELADFSAETNAAFWIEDSNGNIIYPNESGYGNFYCFGRSSSYI